MNDQHHNATNKEDALRDADIWGDSVTDAARQRLDPPDQVKFLTEVIERVTEDRDEIKAFVQDDDLKIP